MSAPELTAAQKREFVALCDAYRAVSGNFKYSGHSNAHDATRNAYAGGLETALRNGKFQVNCALLAQLLYMGRSAADFCDLTSYSNQITKAFNWGYYFAFPHRRVHRRIDNTASVSSVTMRNTSRPPNSAPGSTVYDAATWTRDTYALAGDMAFELWAIGCEIPYAQIQPGDIAFVADRNWVDMGNGRQSFRRITHVMACCGISIVNGFKHPVWIDSTAQSPVGRCSTGTGYTLPAMALAAQYELHIVMCARHPAAFGLGGNVPERIETI